MAAGHAAVDVGQSSAACLARSSMVRRQFLALSASPNAGASNSMSG